MQRLQRQENQRISQEMGGRSVKNDTSKAKGVPGLSSYKTCILRKLGNITDLQQ